MLEESTYRAKVDHEFGRFIPVFRHHCPDFGPHPGTTLIDPCSEDGLLPGAGSIYQLPQIFSQPGPEMLPPSGVPGVSVQRPQVLGDGILYADRRSSREIRKSIRSLEKQITIHQEKIDNRIGFDPVSNDPVINQRAAEARLRHLQHEIEVFRSQIEQLQEELVNRGESP